MPDIASLYDLFLEFCFNKLFFLFTVKLQLQATSAGEVVIKGVCANRYLAMNRDGRLFGAVSEWDFLPSKNVLFVKGTVSEVQCNHWIAFPEKVQRVFQSLREVKVILLMDRQNSFLFMLNLDPNEESLPNLIILSICLCFRYVVLSSVLTLPQPSSCVQQNHDMLHCNVMSGCKCENHIMLHDFLVSITSSNTVQTGTETST